MHPDGKLTTEELKDHLILIVQTVARIAQIPSIDISVVPMDVPYLQFIHHEAGCAPSKVSRDDWSRWFVICWNGKYAFVKPYQRGTYIEFRASGPDGEWNHDVSVDEMRCHLRRFFNPVRRTLDGR